MDRNVKRWARFAATTCFVLLLATAAGPGCGGTGTGPIGGEAGADGPAGDAAPDTTSDRSTVDAKKDRSTADVPADRSPSDAPADVSPTDAPADTSPADAPADRPTSDAPASCSAGSCPSGCCTLAGTCEPWASESMTSCGTAGATCSACGAGLDCDKTSGKCICDATSCPNGCCNGGSSGTCEAWSSESATSCGTAGASCAACTNGLCDTTNGTCACDAHTCPSGCCKGGASGTCEAYSAQSTSSCGTAGASCAACSTGTCTSGICGGAAVCGNGVRESGEQCDDGNLVDLDGCDSTCHFEQVTRATRLVLEWAPDTFCTADVLLAAIQDPPLAGVHSTLQGDVDTAVTAGTTSVIFKYFAITDLTGMSGTTSVGSYDGAPVAYTAGVNGNADLDWWYTLNTTTAGGSPLFTPTSVESAGTFTGGVLNASGGHVLISAFGVSLLDMASVKLQLPIASPASAPTASTGASPGHLASEHLDPALTSFAKGGGTNAAPTGLLCGNVTAASLAATPVPATLQTNCKEGYGATHDMLDVFVFGCTATAIFTVTVINPVQPDQVNPDAPAAGAGGPYKFQESGTHHVDGCTDKGGAVVTPYTACLEPAAYSMYAKMAVDRVILDHP